MLISDVVISFLTVLLSNIACRSELVALFLHHKELLTSLLLLFLEYLIVLLESADSLTLIHLDLKVEILHKFVYFMHDLFSILSHCHLLSVASQTFEILLLGLDVITFRLDGLFKLLKNFCFH